MSWRDQLQPASFRGVAFHVEADDASFGRRVQLHEYPKRDKPYAEDLGRKAREIGLTAFLVGDDYMAARDKLLAAIEEPGPGTLVHPWYGQMTVVVKDDGCRVTHSRQDGGLARIQLTFVESGELVFPSASAALGAGTLTAADHLQEVTQDDFVETFQVEALPAWVLEDAAAVASDSLGKMEAALATVGGVLANPVSALGDLGQQLQAPAVFAQRVFGLFSKASAVVDAATDMGRYNFLRALGAVRAMALFLRQAKAPGLAPARAQLVDNRNALAALQRRALLVQASGMAASMPLPVYDDAQGLRAELLRALDDEAVDATDQAYDALMDLRAKVHADMTARMRDSARLKVIQPREVMPALALAYDLYEEPGRADEIVARNRVRHPGFVPAEPVKVLSA